MADKTISNLSVSDLRSVYSGRDGKCCCGCSGKHSYNSALVAEASTDRGYPVTEDEVNDRMVKRVLNLVKKNEAVVINSGDHLALVIGERLYVAYLAKGVKVS